MKMKMRHERCFKLTYTKHRHSILLTMKLKRKQLHNDKQAKKQARGQGGYGALPPIQDLTPPSLKLSPPPRDRLSRS